MYKTLNGQYSRRRYSKILQLSYFQYNKLDEITQKKIETNTQYGYGVRDFKTNRLYLVEFISSGRWKFLGKHFNKLDDINLDKAKLIKNFCKCKNNCTNKSTNNERGILWVQGVI